MQDCIAPGTTSSSEKIELIRQQFRVFMAMQGVRIYDELLLNAYPMIISLLERFLDDIRTLETEFRNSVVALADCEAKCSFLTRFGAIFE